MPRDRYSAWTGDWVRRAAATLSPQGSLFLNVGAKPTDPWTAIDVAQAVRPHLKLQNTIHWIKSIAIEKALAGSRAGLDRDLAVGHYKPINSRRFRTTATSSCSISHRKATRRSTVRPLASATRTRQTSDAGAPASGVRGRGNTWFIPYETIQNREKDRPACSHLPSPASRDVSAPAGP